MGGCVGTQSTGLFSFQRTESSRLMILQHQQATLQKRASNMNIRPPTGPPNSGSGHLLRKAPGVWMHALTGVVLLAISVCMHACMHVCVYVSVFLSIYLSIYLSIEGQRLTVCPCFEFWKLCARQDSNHERHISECKMAAHLKFQILPQP